jgi:hypothetical protein
MTREEILRSLELLGGRMAEPVEITIAGGAALVLAHGLDRQTADVDALVSTPPFDTCLREAIASVAAAQELSERWLNDAAKGFVDVVGPGFTDRRVLLKVFGKLTVYALSRRDLILMKLYAMRPEDIEDLQALEPTDGEVDFVEGQLDRIDKFNPGKALAISLYLEQGGVGNE